MIYNGDEGIRTLDPLLARQVLSQLSYTPRVLLSIYMWFKTTSAVLLGSKIPRQVRCTATAKFERRLRLVLIKLSASGLKWAFPLKITLYPSGLKWTRTTDLTLIRRAL